MPIFTIELTSEEINLLFRLIVEAEKEMTKLCRKNYFVSTDLDHYKRQLQAIQKKLFIPQLKALLRIPM